MLLASRPVVYIGFSLRDPDFLYVRDLLANTYLGGQRDHYAVMANVSLDETDYWRRYYGIHLIGYQVVPGADGSDNHSGLLCMLDDLSTGASGPAAPSPFGPNAPETVLALARHAAALMRTEKAEPELSIRVHAERAEAAVTRRYYRPDRFDGYQVKDFLLRGPDRAILIGLPGAGKSYALRRAAADLGEALHRACLGEDFDPASTEVPVLVDLKMYRGDVRHLVSGGLPVGLPLDEVARHFRLKVFLDAFNEMPREYWDSGAFEADFSSFLTALARSSLVISSRTSDGLQKCGLPMYSFDEVEPHAVDSELARLGIQLGGRFADDFRRLLQRPFFFQYLRNGTISLPAEAAPSAFHHAYFDTFLGQFCERFDKRFPIMDALAMSAYNALDQGEQAFPLSLFVQATDDIAEEARIAVSARDIAN